MTLEEQKEIWKRGEKVLETLLTHFDIETVEALGKYLDKKENRKGFGFNTLMERLEKYKKTK